MSEPHVLAAPLDGVSDGRLVIRHGLGNASVGSDATMAELYTARGTGRTPRARCRGGTVELTYPLLGRVTDSDEIILNGSIPWEIEVRGAVEDVRADLSRACVRSVDVEGATMRARLDLAHPDGTMPIRLRGVGLTVIRRPAGVPVRVRLARGGRWITVDDQTVAECAGPTTLASPGFAEAHDRIDISVDSADRLTLTTTDLTDITSGRQRDVVLAATKWFSRVGVSGVVWPSPDHA